MAAERLAEIRGIGEYQIPAWFKNSFLDLKEDIHEAAAQNKRLLVYFGQNGCPYCAELFNNNFSQKHIVDYTRKHFDALEINLWGDREVTDFSGEAMSEKQFAAKHKVWFTPTILFFDKHNQQVLRINGYYPPHQFLSALKYVAEKHEKELSFREYYVRHSPPSAAGRLHTEAFFANPPYNLAIREQGRPIAVFFEQKDCAGCDQLHNNIFKHPTTMEQIKRFKVIQLNRWGDTPVVTPDGRKITARKWADELDITYVPSAVLFDEGKEVIRVEAFLKSFHVQSVLDYVASGAYRRQSSLQRFIQERADRLREQGIIIDLWR